MELAVEPQLQSYHGGDDAIRAYFQCGYSYRVIVQMLAKYEGLSISVTTLKRRLAVLALKRHASDSDLRITQGIQHHIQEHGNTKGYRSLTHVLRAEGHHCTFTQVMRLLKQIDPEASNRRRQKKLERRVYSALSCNSTWHADGYDKLKPLGFPIHGAIDGFSRKILWLKVLPSNNDPNAIAQCFLTAVQHYGAPKLLRTDCGTENVIVAGMQAFFRSDEHAHRYGKSVSNQRIEALWSQLRPHVQSWKEFFKGLIDSNQLEPGHEIHMACARFSFASLIQHTLNNFTTYWNQHHIRKSSECPAGKPDELFFLGESVSMSIAPDMLQAAREEIQYSETITGDSDIDNYFSYVCETRGYLQPSTKSQGLNLYCNLIEAQSDS